MGRGRSALGGRCARALLVLGLAFATPREGQPGRPLLPDAVLGGCLTVGDPARPVCSRVAGEEAIRIWVPFVATAVRAELAGAPVEAHVEAVSGGTRAEGSANGTGELHVVMTHGSIERAMVVQVTERAEAPALRAARVRKERGDHEGVAELVAPLLASSDGAARSSARGLLARSFLARGAIDEAARLFDDAMTA